MLTGNVKLSCVTHLFGITTVQLMVEVDLPNGPDTWQGMPTSLGGICWRKATADDLQYLKIKGELK